MFITLYFIALSTFFLIDMVWLGLVAKNFYAKHIGFLMKTTPNWGAAILFYLLFIAGLVLFVIIPAKEKQSLMQALWYGVLFGLVTYATYDLTNFATIKNWPFIVTVVDLLWGMTISGLVSWISMFIANKLGV